jgi:hypothetical protein
MHKNVTKCNETLSKWCKNKHGASKIIDTLETYQSARRTPAHALCRCWTHRRNEDRVEKTLFQFQDAAATSPLQKKTLKINLNKECEPTRQQGAMVRLQGPRPPEEERTGDFTGEGTKP